MAQSSYQQMWEDFGTVKSARYLDYKFIPTHRSGLTHYLREELIYQLLDPQETDVILDIGCASGRQLFLLAPRIKEGFGMDIAKSFIDKAVEVKAKKGFANLNFVQAVVEEIPFPDNFFDKVICGEVLEHVVDKDVALRELLRVLKPGGALVVTVPNLNGDATLWGRFLRLLKIRKFQPLENFSEVSIAEHGDAHVREFDRESLVSWLKSYGLGVLSVQSVSFIDGPFFDFLLKFPLHIGFTQKLIIKFEQFLTNLGLSWGRHLAVKAKKK